MIEIQKGERGLIRLFALDLPPEQAEFLREPGAVAQMLGVSALDHDQIDVIRIVDLEELGLVGYLTTGLGVPADQIDPERAVLDGLRGHVLAIRSKAFAGQAMTLRPDPGLRLIATFREPGADWGAQPLTASSAQPFSAKPSPRAARNRARRIGATLFAAVMGLIILLLLWIVL